MGEKLLKLMKSEGLTSSRLAELLGTGASNISHIISGRSKPGYDLLRKILLSFPRINPDWLLLDDETMYRTDDTPKMVAPEVPDLFATETSAPAEDSHMKPEPKENTPPTSADRQQSGIADFQNLTSATVQRIIVIYSDRSFETFTPKQG